MARLLLRLWWAFRLTAMQTLAVHTAALPTLSRASRADSPAALAQRLLRAAGRRTLRLLRAVLPALLVLLALLPSSTTVQAANAPTPGAAHALEEALAQRLSTLGGVRSARVHLAADPLEPATLSSVVVLLTLDPGQVFGAAQVEGVVRLVVAGVAGLRAERVTVVDHQGRVLTAPLEPREAVAAGRSLRPAGTGLLLVPAAVLAALLVFLVARASRRPAPTVAPPSGEVAVSVAGAVGEPEGGTPPAVAHAPVQALQPVGANGPGPSADTVLSEATAAHPALEGLRKPASYDTALREARLASSAPDVPAPAVAQAAPRAVAPPFPEATGWPHAAAAAPTATSVEPAPPPLQAPPEVLERVRRLVARDPRLAAEVVRDWLAADAA